MLTRLKVSGFKNLKDVDVRFGPFTCIAGPNAAGKSNLFDAIRFLGLLAQKTLMEAALSVRNEAARNTDVRTLFHQEAGRLSDRMSFEVEMIAPKEAYDDLGQHAQATANLLKYTLALQYREAKGDSTGYRGPIEIEKEELVHIPASRAAQSLLFDHNARWRNSALRIKHRTAPFISTSAENDRRIIKLHQDGGSSGRALSNPATQPRTVLSVARASESPTALCAKREMESWMLLQLEPAALREPDPINAPFHLASNGSHLPATLYRLATSVGSGAGPGRHKADPDAVYRRIANRLKGLIDDVESVRVERDEKRELLTLFVTGRDGTDHPARSLSDGTLRFLALAVLEMDPWNRGLICLEEPENGIHPERIPAMLSLLQDIATDPEEPADETNPLSQVIINTHSPAVVMEVPDNSLLMIESRVESTGDRMARKTLFSHLADTWRCLGAAGEETMPKGQLLAYLTPVPKDDSALQSYFAKVGRAVVAGGIKKRARVIDRPEFQLPLLHVAE